MWAAFPEWAEARRPSLCLLPKGPHKLRSGTFSTRKAQGSCFQPAVTQTGQKPGEWRSEAKTNQSIIIASPERHCLLTAQSLGQMLRSRLQLGARQALHSWCFTARELGSPYGVPALGKSLCLSECFCKMGSKMSIPPKDAVRMR